MITVYTTRNCSFCSQIKRLLDYKGYAYQEMNAELPEIAAEAYRLSGALTVPITVVDDNIIVGWNLPKLMGILNKL